MTRRDRGVRGQATVELALALPLILALALFAVQVAMLARDQIMVVNAAREGARAAAVDPSNGVARNAAEGSGALAAERLDVQLSRNEGAVTVTVQYRSRTDVALVGPLLGDVTISASSTMRLEDGRIE